jgi:hypothetical protein
MGVYARYVFALLIMVGATIKCYSQDFSAALEESKQQHFSERVFLNTDRFVYTTDEVVWIHGMVMEMYGNRLSCMSGELTIEVRGMGGPTYMVQRLPIDSGLVSGAMVLTEGMPEDALYINAYTDHSMKDNPYKRMIICNDKVVPDFRIRLAVEEKTYFPGDELTARFFFADHYNEPLKKIDYTVKISDGDRTVQQWDGRTSREGFVDVIYKIPGSFTAANLLISIEASGKNGTGSLTGLVPVYSEHYFAFVFPEGNNLLAGEPSVVSVLVLDAFGRPYGEQAMIVDQEQNVVQQAPVDVTGHAGFQFTPERDHQYYFRLLKPFLSDKLVPLPDVQAKGYNLVLKGSIGNDMVLEALNTTGVARTCALIGLHNDELVYQENRVVEGGEIFRIDRDKISGTFVTFGLLLAESNTLVAQRTVWIEQGDTHGCALANHTTTTEVRQQVDFALDCGPDDITGSCFTAVFQPWSDPPDINPDLTDMEGSIQYYSQLSMMNDGVVPESGYRADIALAMVPAYFNFEQILGLEQPEYWWQTPQLIEGRALWTSVNACNNRQIVDGMIFFENASAPAYFLASNPELLHAFEREPEKRKPAYKTLLESGTDLPKVIYTMKPYQLEGNKIVFYGSRNSLLFQQGALIVVDGVQLGEDASVLNNISPFDVDEIKISTNPMDIQRYTGLNSVGLIEITTKRGGDEGDNSGDPAALPSAFESPDYSRHPSRNKGHDLRRTLFWQCGRGTISEISPVSYYNSDIRGAVDVEWSILFKNGKTVVLKTQYNVK